MNLPVGSIVPNASFLLAGEGLDVLPRMKLVLMRSGYSGSLACVGEELRKEADAAYETGKLLSRPAAMVRCGPPGSFPPDCAPREFYGAALSCVFVSTLGEAVDEEARELFSRGSALKATLLDSWASESLEAFNESIHRALSEIAAESGLRAVKMNGVERFSPGYGGVSVLANRRLLDALPRAPASASEKTGILFPRKSTVCLLAFESRP